MILVYAFVLFKKQDQVCLAERGQEEEEENEQH